MHLAYLTKDKTRNREVKNDVTVQFNSPWGLMSMSTSELGICKIGFPNEPLSNTPVADQYISSEIREMCNALDKGCLPIDLAQNLQNAIDFINGKNDGEDIWLCPICTDFQFSVYCQLLTIPSGKTATYSEVAAAIDRPTATRAVATAIAKNPIAILVPCHRIVPTSGGTGNYFWGSDLKRQLLEYESRR